MPQHEARQGLGAAPARHRHRRSPADGGRLRRRARSASPPTAPRPTSSEQHIGLARKLGVDTVGFLMMAHMIAPEELLEQAKLMESYGANCVYCTDSAGYMLPDDVTRAHRAAARRARARDRDRLSRPPQPRRWAIANSLAAIEAGARAHRRARRAGLGAGAGNTPLEVFVAVLRPHGRRARRRPVQDHGRRRGPGRADDGSRRCASTATR